jgi:hypothetical protein
VDGPDADKTELIKLENFMDTENPASKYSQKFTFSRIDTQRIGSIFYLLKNFCVIENLMPKKESTDKTKIFLNLLKGQALSYFEHHLKRRLEAEDSELPDDKLIELVLRYIGYNTFESAPCTCKSTI